MFSCHFHRKAYSLHLSDSLLSLWFLWSLFWLLHYPAIKSRILWIVLISFPFMFNKQVSKSIVCCVCSYHTSVFIIVVWVVTMIYVAFPAFSLVPNWLPPVPRWLVWIVKLTFLFSVNTPSLFLPCFFSIEIASCSIQYAFHTCFIERRNTENTIWVIYKGHCFLFYSFLPSFPLSLPPPLSPLFLFLFYVFICIFLKTGTYIS